MKKHIFFDLDNTLWDFKTNSRECLNDIYHQFGLKAISPTSLLDFMTLYEKNNAILWKKLEQNLISKDFLREERFIKTLKDCKIYDDNMGKEMSTFYLKECPLKKNLLPNALYTLQYLREKYKLHIVTNGFIESQEVKLSNTGLKVYFSTVTTPDDALCHKPDSRIFLHALDKAGANINNSVYIGDNLEADVLPSLHLGIETLWFKGAQNLASCRNISNLIELRKIY